MGSDAEKKRGKRIPPIGRAVTKSQEAALAAVQTFNNPLITFRAEIFIVLMHIAWTYLLHAYYRKEGIKYNRKGRHGTLVYWGLRKCIDSEDSPLDADTKNNLSFLIGLRNEVEHRMIPPLDDMFSAKLQACCVNYKHYVEKLFGKSSAVNFPGFSLQFSPIGQDQIKAVPNGENIPANVREFIQDFESGLSDEELNSPRYSHRFFFVPKMAKSRGQADKVIEFISADSPLADKVNTQYAMIKETDRNKYLPGQIVAKMREEGFAEFNMHHHTELWKSLKARDPGKGYGVWVADKFWYWYERWVDEVRKHCRENAETYEQ